MKILKIEAIDNLKERPEAWDGFDGFRVTTDTKVFTLLIENSPHCCESFGTITSADDFEEFIGAEIQDVRLVDNADYNDCEILKKEAGDYVDVFDCAFIDFKTDRGTLQFAVYNSHNGYYGHDIRLIETAIKDKK